jgi:hypothetical protein
LSGQNPIRGAAEATWIREQQPGMTAVVGKMGFGFRAAEKNIKNFS